MDSKDEYDAIDSDYNQETIKFFSLAAESGCSDAMINLASLYASKNLFDDAMKYYELAYKNGSPLGAYSLAVAHHFGIGGFSVDHKKRLSYIVRPLNCTITKRKKMGETTHRYRVVALTLSYSYMKTDHLSAK